MNGRASVLAAILFAAALAGCAASPAISGTAAGARPPGAGPRIYEVSDFGTLCDLLANKANPGDVIRVAPGVYNVDRKKIDVARSGIPSMPIFVQGVCDAKGNRPVLDARHVATQRGVFYFEEATHDVVVENFEIRNAQAAAYFRGTNIIVRNIYSHHNDNGFFSTHSADYIVIDSCEIAYNGVHDVAPHPASHNFYFSAKHQIVRNCYIHHTIEGENFKSRGENTIFAYNWVEDDAAYSVEIASGSAGGTLWLGNVVVKRDQAGGQRRILSVGDGSGVAEGKLFIVNNTVISKFADDIYLFTHPTSTTDIVMENNAFAGPSKMPFILSGSGRVTGRNNAFPKDMPVPAGLTNSIFTNDPGFEDGILEFFRPVKGSPLIDAGDPSPEYKEVLNEVFKDAAPMFEPLRRAAGRQPRPSDGKLDIGAYEFVK